MKASIDFEVTDLETRPGWTFESNLFWKTTRRFHGWCRTRSGYEPDEMKLIKDATVLGLTFQKDRPL